MVVGVTNTAPAETLLNTASPGKGEVGYRRRAQPVGRPYFRFPLPFAPLPASPHQNQKRREVLALFVLSAGVLGYELVLLRIFSVLMWYHFASLAIAMALLGLSLGGVVVAVRGGAGRPACGALWFASGVAGVFLLLCAIRASPQFAALALAPFHQPFYKPFARPQAALPGWGLALRLGALAIATGLPFAGAGTALAGVLRRRAPAVHRPYAAVLLGSACGAAGSLAALATVAAPAALVLAAGAGLSAAALFRGRPRWAGAAVLAAAVAAVSADRGGWAELPFARGRYQPELLAVRWNPMSRVAAYPLAPGDTLRPFGLSPAYRGPVPPRIGLVVDDSGYTNLYEGRACRENPDYFRSLLSSLAWHLRPRARALVIGPGGGKDVWVALSFPGSRVRAVEINPEIVEMVQNVFGAFTGRPYSLPSVELVVADARWFLDRDTDRYDVIEASAVFGRMPPAAGAFTLSEDFLHTLEAFRTYWNRLSDRGILSVNQFIYERRLLRLAALARAALEAEGIGRPEAHVRIVADRGMANVMVARAPFSPEDDAVLQARADRLRFRILYPDAQQKDTLLARVLEAPDLGALLAGLPFDLRPPTDDRPFFYYTLRASGLWSAVRKGREGFDNRGVGMVAVTFVGLTAVACALFLLPLAGRLGFPRGAGPAMGYAAAVGTGYMFLEIALLKRLILFLGHPVYAAAAVLTAFLLGGGAGSLSAPRFAKPSRLALVTAGAVALAAAWGLWGQGILDAAAGFSRPGRWLAASAFLLPLAFLLGIPFPAGLALLGRRSGDLVPWCWAANGAAGVAGSLGTLLVAMHWGYTAAILAGGGAYAAAAALVPLLKAEGTR